MNTRFFQMIAVVATIAAAPASQAKDASELTTHIFVGDLDLRSSAGQAALQHRVSQAVRNLCEQTHGNPSLADYEHYHACRNQAYAQVTPQVNSLIAAAAAQTQMAASSK